MPVLHQNNNKILIPNFGSTMDPQQTNQDDHLYAFLPFYPNLGSTNAAGRVLHWSPTWPDAG